MSGRRKVPVSSARDWVFNRMADVYDARPAYPTALVDALAQLAGQPGAHIADVGAGIGQLALPLAERGFTVSALEPAEAMLARLRVTAAARGLAVHALHAAAEALPLHSGSVELVLIADALHFLDVALSGAEIARVLAPHGALALVTCEPTPTPFMRALTAIMEDAAPRRPRAVANAATQLFALAGIDATHEQQFLDSTELDADRLERILRSISYIGPAMHAARFAAFAQRVRALPGPHGWARTATLRSGRRS